METDSSGRGQGGQIIRSSDLAGTTDVLLNVRNAVPI